MPPVFRRFGWATVFAAACVATAAKLYPGGTPIDPSTPGYAIFQNFLSDLGMTTSYSGKSNVAGAISFVMGLVALIAGFAGFLPAHLRLYEGRLSRRLAGTAALVAVCTCAAFLVVGLTPENRLMTLHVAANRVGWAGMALVAPLLGAASLTANTPSQRVALAWFIMAIAVSTNFGMMAWGPSTETLHGLRLQVTSQKVATLLAICVILFQAYETDRIRRFRSAA